MDSQARVNARESSLTRLGLKGKIQKVTEQLSLFHLDRAQRKYRKNDKRYSQWESSIPELTTPHIPDDTQDKNKRTGEPVQETQDNKRKDKRCENTKSSDKPELASAECMLEPASHWKSSTPELTDTQYCQRELPHQAQTCCQREPLHQAQTQRKNKETQDKDKNKRTQDKNKRTGEPVSLRQETHIHNELADTQNKSN